MSIDIVSISIEAKSTGIDQAATSLNNLATASDKAEQAVSKVGVSNKTSSDTASTAASAIDKLLVKYQAQADLLGATTSVSNAYNAALKGGSEAHQSAATFLGAEVDAYKALSQAQTEAISMNKALDSSYDSLSKQADAYYQLQVKQAATMQSLNVAGQQAADYAKLQDAIKALEAETIQLANAEAKLAAQNQAIDYQKYINSVKQYSAAQSEAIKMNNDLASAEQRQAKAAQDSFNAIGPTRANLDQATQASEKWLASLKSQADRAGLTGKALRDYNAELLRTQAAQMGVAGQADPMIQKLQDTEKASSHTSGGLSGITRELIVMGHEVSQGNYTRLGGSLIVMGERADAGGKAVKMFESAVEAAGGSITAVLAPLALIAAAVVTAGAAFMTWLHSTQAIHEFNQELILTGGYAGASANQMYTMADSIGKVYGNVGTAREAMTKLVATGKFTSDQINDITKAAVGLYTYGGVSIDKTIAQFEKLAKEPLTNTERAYSQVSKAAVELDQSMHFLEPTVLQAIIDQEKLGNLHEASAIATKALSEEETKRAQELADNLTMLGRIAHDTSAAFTNMWNSLWTTQSPQQKLKGVVDELKALPSAAESSQGMFGGNVAMQLNIEKRKMLLKQAADYQVQILAETDKAQQKAAQDETNTDANLAQNYLRMLQDKEKGNSRLQDEIDKYNKNIAAMGEVGLTVSKQQQDADLAYLTKTYGEKHKVKAEGFADINLEISAIKAATQEQVDADDMAIKSSKAAYDAKKIDVFADQANIAVALQAKLKAITDGYNAEKSAIDASIADSKRSSTEKLELQNRETQAKTAYLKSVNAVNEAINANNNLVTDLASKAADAQSQADAKVIDSIKQSISTIQEKIDAYNRLPEAIRQAGVTEKQIQDQITQSKIDDMQAEIAQTIANNNVEDPLIKARLELLRQEITLKNNLKDAQVTQEAQQATNTAIINYNTAWKQANKQIGDDLASAIIDGGGKGWKKLIKDMELAFAKMVLRPILEPISSSVASLVTQVGASSPGAASGSASSAVSLAQAASNIYSAISGGFSSLSTSVAGYVQSAQNALGSSFGGTGAGAGNATGAFANGVGTAAGYAGGIAAGHVIGNAIAGQYEVAHGQAVTNIASIVGAAIGGPIGGAIGGAIGGLFNRAFGMGSKNVTSQGISGTVSDSGVSGQAYSNWHQDGGWFRSDKNGTDNSALGAGVTNTFASTLTSLKSASTDFAKNINVSADALTNYSKTFDITLTDDTTKNQQAITDFFTKMGDDMANKLVPNIADFAKTGETASGTLQRLSETFQATNAIMDLFGADTAKVFGGLGLESAKARQYLVDLAGGISALNTQVSFYATNFLTESEKIAPVQKAVTAALSEMGLSGVTTIDQFKNVVKGLDLSTQAGAQTFESLMQLAPAFKQVADYTDAATKAAQDQAKAQADLFNSQLAMQLTIAQLTGDTSAQTAIIAQQRAIEIASLDATLQPLQQRINMLNDEAAAVKEATAAREAFITSLNKTAQGDFNVLSKAITAAKANAQAAYDAQAAILNAQISSLNTVKTNIDSLSSALDSAINSMIDNTQLTMSRVSAQALLDQALSGAKNGNLPSADSLKNVFSTLGKDASGSFSSYTEYAKDLGITAGKMADLNSLTKAQGTVVDQQLQVAKDQLDFAKTSFDAEIAKYDLTLKVAQDQLDAMNGTQVAIKSLADSITAFAASSSIAIANNLNAGKISAPNGASGDTITQLYQSLLGRAPDAGGYAFYSANAAKGTTSLEIAAAIMSSPEYASLHPNGSHANGLDSVPFDGYTAKLHKGEMVLPAKQAKGVAQGDDMKAVVQAINNLKDDNSSENQAMASALIFLKKLFQNVSPNGQTLQVTQTVIS